MDVCLVMFKADGARRDFPLTRDRIVIGRTSSCDLRIPLSSVSRQHCEVYKDSSGAKLRDLGSSNGTYHNNVRVQEVSLAAGDEIVIGPVVFTVQIDGKPETIEPVRTILNDDSQPVDMAAAAAPAAIAAAASVAAVNEELPVSPVSDEVLPPVEAAEEEVYSPTIDLEEDPIAALEAMTHQQPDIESIPLISLEDEEPA